ncbi:hypothetical protein B0A49_11314 [Cryomyces minteri]|uniref:Lid2 complex component snt2 n=1 Tax=Cryomyces minteri TaxID=331657 RepID=A0A4U0WM25_9PEZI|nr:hypothetical protein B0A49_11314 [Cryomyces minteri]
MVDVQDVQGGDTTGTAALQSANGDSSTSTPREDRQAHASNPPATDASTAVLAMSSASKTESAGTVQEPPMPPTQPTLDDSTMPARAAAEVASRTRQDGSSHASTTTPADPQLPLADRNVPDPSPYGTRSRNRTGNPRPNYAEDRDADMELDLRTTFAAVNGASKKRAVASASVSLSPSGGEDRRSPAPVASKFTAVNGAGQVPHPHSAPRDTIPGTSSFSANPSGDVAPPPSKKRKAAGNAHTVESGGNLHTPSAVVRRAANAKPAGDERATNMMLFEKTGARLKNGKLVADDGTSIAINDHVYLVCEPPGEPYYLCRIMEFLHKNADDKNSPIDSMRVNWYYRPRDVQRYNNDTRLLYGTMHSDLCPITSLRGKCTILHRSEIKDLDEYRKGKDCFWFNQIFDRFIHRWYEVIPTAQIINVPEKVKKALDVRWKFVAVEIGRVKELTSAAKSCKRCTDYCASNDSVECAVCHNTYHMTCVRPPLLKKPSRGFAWACGPCSRAQERKLEARHTPLVGEAAVDPDEEELVDEEEDDAGAVVETTAPSPNGSDAPTDQHPGTQAEIALAKMWPMRYLGIHCRVEDALQYDDRAIYPRASSRLGPRHQANVNVWHGRPVEMVKPAEIKRRYVKGGGHKKDAKLSKETIAALEADKAERATRPKWVMDEPIGYVRRGEDHDNKSPRNTARLLFKMPTVGEQSSRGEDDAPPAPADDALVDAYMIRAKTFAKDIGVPDYSTDFLDKAIQLLYDNKYDAEAALKQLKKVDRQKDLNVPLLTREEAKRFVEGVAKYGSEHRQVRLHMKTPHIPNSTIVRFYYLWKHTSQGREVWGSFGGRKGTKRKVEQDAAAKLLDDIADDHDDSAFDNEKALKRQRGFQCKFCSTTTARQWRRAPGVAPGQSVPADGRSGDEARLELALCQRCAGLWRKYAVKWEDMDEVFKKTGPGGGRTLKKKVDEELLREYLAASEASSMSTPDFMTAAPSVEVGTEPPKKKAKADKDHTSSEALVKKKEKVAPPPKPATPPPPAPEPPRWRVLPCAVCKLVDPLGEQPLSCSHCRLTVHRQCYGLADQRVTGKWVCEQCTNDRNPSVSTVSYIPLSDCMVELTESKDYVCTLCPIEFTPQLLLEPPRVSHKKKTDREREKERLEKELVDQALEDYITRQADLNRPLRPREPLKRTAGNNWIHVVCAVWTPEIKFSDAKTLERAEGIGSIPSMKFEQICKLCKQSKGACVSCHQCHANFHVTCAHEAGYTFGFDVTPVKGTRRDTITTITLGEETGSIAAVIWCKDHTVKTIVHPINETVEDAGKTKNALQLYVENYKQADLTLTGTMRKANLVSQTAKIVAQAVVPQGADRRTSLTNVAKSNGRGGRNSSVSTIFKAEDLDAINDSAASADQQERTCINCKIDVSPKWSMVEGPGAPAAVPAAVSQSRSSDADSHPRPTDRTQEESALLNGDMVNGDSSHHLHSSEEPDGGAAAMASAALTSTSGSPGTAAAT